METGVGLNAGALGPLHAWVAGAAGATSDAFLTLDVASTPLLAAGAAWGELLAGGVASAPLLVAGVASVLLSAAGAACGPSLAAIGASAAFLFTGTSVPAIDAAGAFAGALHSLGRLDYPTRLLLSWTNAALLAWMLAVGTRLSRWQGAGIGIMSVPLWLTVWNFYNSFQVLADPGSVLLPYTRDQLSFLYSRSILADVGYLGAGFLVYGADGDLRRLVSQPPRVLARKLREAGFPMGGRSEGRSILVGWAFFPMVLLGAIALDVAASGVEALQRGEESQVWKNMTVYHAVLISLAAGFGEELLYRGFLMTALAAAFARGPGMGRTPAMVLAIAAQALVFGFAHAGYGTVIHVIMPFLFALVAGVVAWRFGIWSAIVLHALIDLYVFGVEAGNDLLLWILSALLVANVVVAVGWAAYLVAGRLRRNPTHA